MIILLTIVHVLVCFFLVVVVLLQSGKAADLAGAFGGMGSQTAFGPRGAATVLSKATTVAAGLFMVTSLSLSVMATRQGNTGSTVLEKAPVSAPKPATSTPGSVPIQVNPGGGGQPQTMQVPVTPATPPSGQAPAAGTPAPTPAQPAPAKK